MPATTRRRQTTRRAHRAPQRIRLALADNGRGQNGSTPSHGGFGLTGLRARIELLGDTFEAANRLEGGFLLRNEVPA